MVLLLVVAVAFLAGQNTETIRVEWLFFDFDIPIFVLILITAILVVVIDELAGWAWRRRRRKRLEEKKELSRLRNEAKGAVIESAKDADAAVKQGDHQQGDQDDFEDQFKG